MGLALDLVYAAAGVLASPFLLFKAATDRRYRHRLGERFGAAPTREGNAPCLWFHCASVGEVSAAKPLIQDARRRRPEAQVHVSTLTKAGREHAEKALPGAVVHYWPFDFTFAVRRALRRVRPDVVVLTELEVWPNFMSAACKRSIPVVVVNGRLSHRSHRRYRRSAWFWRSTFRKVACVGAQNETYAERFRALGVAPERVVVTGNLKYDAALGFDPASVRAELSEALALKEGTPLWVAGSTHAPEEEIVLAAYRQLRPTHPRLRLLVAPRHLERVGEVEKAIAAAGFAAARRTAGPPPEDAVILLDTVGELSRVYTLASAVYIGGTFCARGGQNMLEPAALGKPILSGTSLENFREIADALVAAGGMRVVPEPGQLAPALHELLRDAQVAQAMGAKAREAVEAGRGAIRSTGELIEKWLAGRVTRRVEADRGGLSHRRERGACRGCGPRGTTFARVFSMRKLKSGARRRSLTHRRRVRAPAGPAAPPARRRAGEESDAFAFPIRFGGGRSFDFEI